MYQKGFLKDDEGNLSMMRLLSFMSWFVWAFVIVYQAITNTYNEWIILAVGSLVFMPKVFQKVIEAKANIKNEK